MKTKLKLILAALGIAMLGAGAFSGCAHMGNGSSHGSHMMGNPESQIVEPETGMTNHN